MEQNGILLLSLGNPNYGKMAAALAAMIKAADSTTQIHLSYTESAISHLRENEKTVFDSMAPIPEKYYTMQGMPKFIKAKMYLYELSPFQETLYLDSDIAWLKKSPARVFEELKDIDLTYANSGLQTYSQWADLEKVRTAYNIEKVVGIHSEFVFFRKCEKVEAFFQKAQRIYSNLKVPATVFAGAIPDELPLMIAAELTGMMPHQQPYYPVFWYKRDKKMLHSYQIAKDYYAMSMGGHYNAQHEMDMYNILTTAAYNKLKLSSGSRGPYPYQWKNKNSFLAERQKY